MIGRNSNVKNFCEQNAKNLGLKIP